MMAVGGHRGMGMNAVGAPPGARVGAARERENTLLSLGRAAAHAAVAFVEFDVQVTKDGCPIIFHDDFILTQGNGAVYEKRVTDLLLEEFLSYGPQKGSHKVFKPLLRRTGDGRVLDWKTEEDDSLCTLQEVFEHVSPRLGFNIELKFDDNIMYHRKDLECALQAILQVVFQYARNRPVFFSSFHPDAARMMRELQSLYPVLFLTEGGTSKHHDSRRNSPDDAIRVCLEYDLHGIVSEVRGVLKNPSAVIRAQESNLVLHTYGHLNNWWGTSTRRLNRPWRRAGCCSTCARSRCSTRAMPMRGRAQPTGGGLPAATSSAGGHGFGDEDLKDDLDGHKARGLGGGSLEHEAKLIIEAGLP